MCERTLRMHTTKKRKEKKERKQSPVEAIGIAAARAPESEKDLHNDASNKENSA
jgi:hypothetical protein